MIFSLYRQWDAWNHQVDRAADHAVRFFAQKESSMNNTQAKAVALMEKPQIFIRR